MQNRWERRLLSSACWSRHMPPVSSLPDHPSGICRTAWDADPFCSSVKRSHLTDEQNGSASHAVRQMPEGWSGNELAGGICRDQHADDNRRRSQRFCIKWKQRQDDRQSKHIDKDDQKYRKQRRFFHEGVKSLLFVFNKSWCGQCCVHEAIRRSEEHTSEL